MRHSEKKLIGERARSARLSAGLTLEALAKTTRLSKGHLSRFERGQKTLSVASLLRLADALRVPVGTLLDAPEQGGELLIRTSGELPQIPMSDASSGPFFAMLSASDGLDSFQAMLLTIPANQQTPEPAHHKGREGLFVISGDVELSYAGVNYRLVAGDYAEFNASEPHVIKGLELDSRLLLMALPPQ